MTAVVRPIYIEQGATFTMGFNWHRDGALDANGNPTPGVPYDLTGASARMQIRKTVTSTPPLIDATTENGLITLGTTDGRVDVVLSDADTDTLTVKSAVYDFEIKLADDTVHRLLQGAVTISLNVTRDVV